MRPFERLRKHGISLEDNVASKDIEQVLVNLHLWELGREKGRALVAAHTAHTQRAGALDGLWVNDRRSHGYLSRLPSRLADWVEMTKAYLRSNASASEHEATDATMFIVNKLHEVGVISCHPSQAGAIVAALAEHARGDGSKRHARAPSVLCSLLPSDRLRSAACRARGSRRRSGCRGGHCHCRACSSRRCACRSQHCVPPLRPN